MRVILVLDTAFVNGGQAKVAFDRTLLQAALDHCDGHRGEAASALGLGRNTVTRKLGASRKRR